jgi:hypothetical protein
VSRAFSFLIFPLTGLICSITQVQGVITTIAGGASPHANCSQRLSQTRLTFTSVQNGGAIPAQTCSVLNLGSGTLNWAAQTSVLGAVNNWLSATPNSGTTFTASLTGAPVVTVSVNPAGLQPGVYYGLVTVTATGADNTPQGVVVVLQVLPP